MRRRHLPAGDEIRRMRTERRIERCHKLAHLIGARIPVRRHLCWIDRPIRLHRRCRSIRLQRIAPPEIRRWRTRLRHMPTGKPLLHQVDGAALRHDLIAEAEKRERRDERGMNHLHGVPFLLLVCVVCLILSRIVWPELYTKITFCQYTELPIWRSIEP